MPTIPKEWRVEDVQVFPSAFGPSVEMAVTGEKNLRLSLFAVRPGSFSVQPVTLVKQGDVQASYWQIGDVAYALVSSTPDGGLLKDEAESLSRSLY